MSKSSSTGAFPWIPGRPAVMRVDRTSGAVAAARGSMSLPPSRNQSSTTLSGSYIGSVMGQVHRRNSLFLGATSLEPAPHIEKKLDRVRKMSEARQRQELAGPRPRATQIPTEVGDITLDFVRLVANQYLLKHDRPLLQKTDPVHDLSITDCKAGVGDYSSTVKVRMHRSVGTRPRNDPARRSKNAKAFFPSFSLAFV